MGQIGRKKCLAALHPPPPSTCELLPACEVVTQFPTLARGLAWENPPHCCVLGRNVESGVFDCLMQTKDEFSLPPLCKPLKKKKSYLMFSTCRLQDLQLTAPVHGPCDMKACMSPLPVFTPQLCVHTIGSLMILVSMQAREKRLSVQECKFPK